MTAWQSYNVIKSHHTVTGTLKIRTGVYSPELQNSRDILVWLPDSYPSTQYHYPVIYMQDGQNLFDAHTSYAGEWHVDETLQQLGHEGMEAIVVGIPNTKDRIHEYNPFQESHFGKGRGEHYLAFLVNTLKPMIDRDFRTLPQREHTGIFGSSMGGLISMYAYFHYPKIFGRVGSMSPAFWFNGGAIFRYVEQAPYSPGRIYVDIGSSEGKMSHHETSATRRYMKYVGRIEEILRHKGYRPGEDLLYVEEEGGQHNEAAWSRRLPAALRFLLG